MDDQRVKYTGEKNELIKNYEEMIAAQKKKYEDKIKAQNNQCLEEKDGLNGKISSLKKVPNIVVASNGFESDSSSRANGPKVTVNGKKITPKVSGAGDHRGVSLFVINPTTYKVILA